MNAVRHFLTAFTLSALLINTAFAQTTASFSANPTVGCAPLTVDFTNTSLQANSFFWDFGNGNTSALPNPTSVYLTPGFFTVTLIATNTLTGQKDTLTATNYIHTVNPPNVNFTASPLTGCENNNLIAFNNTSTGAVTYTWDFGDGNSSTLQNPTHVYSSPGTYTVKLIATNGFGCNMIAVQSNYITIQAAPQVSFTSNYTSTCNVNQVFNFTGNGSGITSWNWNFGDGTFSALQNPSHTYSSTGTYNVTLIGTNSSGCTDTAYSNNYISIGSTLVPSYTVNNSTGCGNLTASFNCTVPNGTTWLWNFGDGSPTSNLQNPTHFYASTGNYTITLTVTTASGCNGSTSFPNAIKIDPLPTANFSANQVNICDPFTWHFTNTSVNGATYLWEFGDGTTSTQSAPNHTYVSGTTYNVTLHVFTANGCEDIITLNGVVNIVDYVPGFSGAPKVGCIPLPVNFTEYFYPNVASRLWNFGDGSTSTLQSPSHTYTVIGLYDVKLVVTTTNGCIDSITRSSYIRTVSGFTNYTVPDTIIGCTPFTAAFTDPTLGSNMWHWEFGDGDSSNVKNPSHTYPFAGYYTVTLQTSMPGGCSQFINPYAIVHVIDFIPEPILVLSNSPCSPYQIQVTDSTPGVVQWTWNFGDGTPTSSVQSPTHIYSQPGTYTITVSMVIPDGCPTSQSLTITVGHINPIVVNSPSTCTNDTIGFSISTPGAFVSYTWNFGDGSPTTTQQNPKHVYTTNGDYVPTLTVTDTSGCIQSYTGDTLHIRSVTAGFITSEPTTGCDHLLIHFTNTSTNAVSYLWNFGDSTTATSTSPNHNYWTEGTYTVSLTATSGGCVKTFTQPNFITLNKAHANFSFVSNGTCLPITVTYTDLSTNPVSWLWDFGDGQTSTLQNPVHVFSNIPSSNVTLTITDANGCSTSKSKANTSGLGVQIAASDTVGCKPLNVIFSDLTSTATAWNWDFGDGGNSNQQYPSHTYSDTGSYDITLTVTLASGCINTVVFPDYIHVISPVPDFVSPTVAVCAPSLVTFNNLSQNAVSYLWDFGDGITSTADSPSHIYNIPGDYTISLTAYDSLGCSSIEIKVDYIHVPGTYAYFTLTSQVNCLQNMVQFADSSINATSWGWNFGDGYTSNVQNPQHLYADTGSYIVSLITSDSLGCSSFYSYPDSIVVHPNPDAAGATTYLGGCDPYSASFTNTSSSATNYTWLFGNGDSSNAVNPVYTYTTSGTYTVSLVAINQFGCTDTFTLPAAIVVDKTPDALFTPDATTGCTPLTIQFNNTSGNLQSPSYSWNFGNGQTSTLQSPSVIYTTPGVYTIKLVVQNVNGCADTSFQQITVNQSPTAAGIVSDTAGCGPYTVNFTNQSVNADSYLWVFGDGNSSSLSDPVYTYNASGIFNPYLVASTTNGCTDTFYLNTSINVKLSPIADFVTVSAGGCSGSSFVITDTSSNLSNPVYNWIIGALTSTQQNPSVLLTAPGFYSVSLTVTNDNGCTDTTVKTNFFEVYDNIAPPVTPLLSVSVVNNTSVDIKWLPSAALDLEEYRLYRYNSSTAVFDMIYSELHPNNSNPNVTGIYTDTGLNTLQNVYTYKIQTIDRCGYKLNLSSSVAHTTINVTALEQGTNIKVDWTPYSGCPVSSYEINRTEVMSGVSQLLAVVPASQLSYMDSNLNCPIAYSYRVTALDLCGNTYTSLSDTSAAVPENTLIDQKVEVVRSTVVFNKSVLTEWGTPVIAPNRVMQYNILRSIDNLNFTLIASVPASVHSFIDDQVDVNHQNYFYKIDVINDCNLAGEKSNNSSSILLQSDWVHEKTKLWWTEYDKWDSGVDYYTIEKKDDSGQWVQIKIVNGLTKETELDE